MAEIAIPYHRYAGYLKFLTLVLFVYVATAFSVNVPWVKVLRATLLPRFSLNRDALLTDRGGVRHHDQPLPVLLAGVAGSRGVAAQPPRADTRAALKRAQAFRHIAIDTWAGMTMSNVVAFFIIVTTAATLARPWRDQDRHGRAGGGGAEADRRRPSPSRCSRPGIIGTGLLAVPVLAGSAAYGVAEAFRLQRQPGVAGEPRPSASTPSSARRRLAGAALTLTQDRSDRHAVLDGGDQRRRSPCRSWSR